MNETENPVDLGDVSLVEPERCPCENWNMSKLLRLDGSDGIIQCAMCGAWYKRAEV